jgi:hypothetical protein
MPQRFDDLPFEIDHIIAKKHGGKTTLRNLCLSCCYCNRFKGTDFTGIDPKTKQPARLFHPRRQTWQRHFRWHGSRLIGRTSTGRATIAVLQINESFAVQQRQKLIEEGVFPPASGRETEEPL